MLSTCCKEWAWRPNIFSPAAVARILLWPKKKLKPDQRSMFQVDWFNKFLLDSTFENAPVCAGIIRCRPCCAVSMGVTTNLHDSARALWSAYCTADSAKDSLSLYSKDTQRLRNFRIGVRCVPFSMLSPGASGISVAIGSFA